jgi:hypothetical protein
MAQRLIKVFLPEGDPQGIRNALNGDNVLGMWTDRLEDGTLETLILLNVEHSEMVLDRLAQYFSDQEGYRVILLPVHASLPRTEEVEEETPETREATRLNAARISREELYTTVSETARLNPFFW